MAVEIATAYVSLVPSFRGGVGAIQKEAGQMGQAVSKGMADEVENAGGKSGVLGRAFAGVALAAGGIFAGAKLLGGFLQEAQEAQTVAKQTAAVLSSTGNAAKVSAKDVDDLASALSRKAGIDDELIASGENVLLTFTKVRNEAGKGNDVFNQGTAIALDMSRALGTDMQGSVIQVGKALNDPIKGISALSRVGVSFTEQQKEQIKALTESGDVLGAQKVILAELNTEFGGAAEAAATSGDKMKVAWGNVQEQLGKLLLPVFEKVASFMADILPKAANVLTGVVHSIGEAFDYFRGGFTGEFTNEGSGVLLWMNKIGMFAGDMWAIVKDVFPKMWATIKDVWSKIGPVILGALIEAWDWIQDVWPKVRDGVINVLQEIVGWVERNWDNIRDVLVGVFEALKTAVEWVYDNKPVLIGVLTAIGVGLTVWAVQAGLAAAASVAAGVAAAAAWIAAAAPFVAVGVAIAAVVAGLVWAYQNVEWFRKAIDTFVDGVVAAAKWLADAWTKYSDDVWRVLVQIGKVVGEIFAGIVDAVKTTIDVITDVIQTGIEAFKVAWKVISVLFDIFRDYVYDPLVFYYTLLFDVVVGIVETGIGLIKTAWHAIEDVYTFFRDKVFDPLSKAVGDIKDTIVGAFTDAKDLAKSAWHGIVDIYDSFKSNVFDPLWGAVTDIKNHVIDAFTQAKDGVKTAWDLLKDIVKTPINVVIGFYNNGIRAVWNSVISKIPGVGDLPSITQLNSGGTVPGYGNRDTVPAMLTPGEFVITKDAAAKIGTSTLAALNRGGTIDPGIFGYASGGPVMSVEQTQAWARRQAGKPYVFPNTGPDSYDCSGFTSALINFVLGASNPYNRRHSSGSVGSDPALQRGDGDPKRGLLIGARPPYTTNSVGATVGHTTATIGGMFAEATPPAVRVGGDARGAWALPEHYFMPGFGGPNEEEQGIADKISSLLSMNLPDLGGPPIGDLLSKMFTDLPKKIFDFLVHKMPEVIFDAVKEAISGLFQRDPVLAGTMAHYADGGITRPGPMVVGERGPELLWSNGGEYVQANHDIGRAGGGPLLQVGAIFGDGEFQRMVREEIANMDFERRAAPVAAGRR